MSAIDVEQSTAEEPQHVEHQYGLETHLEMYGHVEGSIWTERTLMVQIDDDRASKYDRDAVVGSLIRDFPVDFDRRNGQILVFDRTDTEGDR